MNTAFKNAFEQKGLFKNVAEKIELEKKVEEENKKAKEKLLAEEHRKQRDKEKLQERARDEFDEIIKTMMYGTADKPKIGGKNFVFHMLCAYIPFPKVQKLSTLKGKQKTCVICKDGVLAIGDILKISTEVLFESISIDMECCGDDERRIKEQEALMKKHFKGKLIGVSSDDTNTVMCTNCFRKFVDWIQYRLMNDDRFVLAAVKAARFKAMKEHE